jgi:hypothetical protein
MALRGCDASLSALEKAGNCESTSCRTTLCFTHGSTQPYISCRSNTIDSFLSTSIAVGHRITECDGMQPYCPAPGCFFGTDAQSWGNLQTHFVTEAARSYERYDFAYLAFCPCNSLSFWCHSHQYQAKIAITRVFAEPDRAPSLRAVLKAHLQIKP